MGEIVLKVGTNLPPEPAYQDGDIVQAFSVRDIQFTHAERIMHPGNFSRQSSGLLTNDTLAQAYCEIMYQYRFERVSTTEIRRTNLFDTRVDILSNRPNARGERIDVPLFVERRLSNANHMMFGSPGREIWYGGMKLYNAPNLTELWNEIETDTRLRRADHTKFPLTRREKQSFLVIKVDDFTSAEKLVLEESVHDRNGNLTRKRRRRVNWRSLTLPTGTTIGHIDDKAREVDIRDDSTFTRTTVVQDKESLVARLIR